MRIMAIIGRSLNWQADMLRWRRDIHQYPETAFEETRASDMVAGLLDASASRSIAVSSAREWRER